MHQRGNRDLNRVVCERRSSPDILQLYDRDGAAMSHHADSIMWPGSTEIIMPLESVKSGMSLSSAESIKSRGSIEIIMSPRPTKTIMSPGSAQSIMSRGSTEVIVWHVFMELILSYDPKWAVSNGAVNIIFNYFDT